MLAKLFLLTLFAVSQAASREPWWIQMFFPNVEFTGKYHPSNYKVEKSPLFPDYVQNPNDVWSPAYWMPYKQAYAQYWIDLIENSTKPEQEITQEAQAQAGNQYGMNGQYGQYEQSNQYGQYGQEQEIAEQASTLAHQIQTQAQNMNVAAQQIVSQVQEEAEKQKEAALNEASQLKEEIKEEMGAASIEAQIISAQIDRAAEAKVEAITQSVAQFEKDVALEFAPLNEKAREIAVEAAEIAQEITPQL